ncbi:MAG: SMP-30/gluconolactonase/LRE family protein [Verrucomicrobiia bacterium]
MKFKRQNISGAMVFIVAILVSLSFINLYGAEKKSLEKKTVKQPKLFSQFGRVEKNDPKFEKLFSSDSIVEKVAEGFVCAQSCLFAKNIVLISDTGSNIIYSWDENNGLKIFQRLRVYSTNLTALYGPAGIAKDQSAKILICHHGDRRILKLENSNRLVSIADYFNWLRFNGPYGIAVKSNGDVYFTDPPFDAIEPGVNSPNKEMTYNGIYRITKNGYVDLLSTKLDCPMGLAFSPKEDYLYVVNQTESAPAVMRIALKKDGTLEKPELFYNLSSVLSQKKGEIGGIAIDASGNIYVATPGGILAIDQQGKQLGSILTDQPATSCGFGNNGKYLYITTRNSLCRVRTAN